ncbi:MAG: hypothetical protein ACM3OC_09785 [Deltaproteobacteria bacterium]
MNRKGQNIAEYSILIALVVAAAVAMQIYVKRGMQGRVKEAVEHRGLSGGAPIGETQFSWKTDQYEPEYQRSAADVSSDRGVNEVVGANGAIQHNGLTETTTRKTGSYEQSDYTK